MKYDARKIKMDDVYFGATMFVVKMGYYKDRYVGIYPVSDFTLYFTLLKKDGNVECFKENVTRFGDKEDKLDKLLEENYRALEHFIDYCLNKYNNIPYSKALMVAEKLAKVFDMSSSVDMKWLFEVETKMFDESEIDGKWSQNKINFFSKDAVKSLKKYRRQNNKKRTPKLEVLK